MATGGAVASGQAERQGDQALEVNDEIEVYLRHFESLPSFERTFET